MTVVGKEKNHNYNTKKHIKRLIIDNMENESIKNHVLDYIENLVNSHNDLVIAYKNKCKELNKLKRKY
jgi:Fe-S cluster assembly iron-binding protein IscA